MHWKKLRSGSMEMSHFHTVDLLNLINGMDLARIHMDLPDNFL